MPDKTHIKYIKVISNTHWDREFRRSFEKTRKDLIIMMDMILDILEKDPDYHSFTLDGHAILVDDYLEMRPEKTQQVKDLIAKGRIVIGPWYTLAEQFSISGEALVRNLLYGKKTIRRYGGQYGTVAYTPASWGQTGQLPQILKNFGLDKMMFYRGISHHESEAEFIWEAPDGSRVLGNRFGLYARYNWYYQVHRAVTRNGCTFEKAYRWGEFEEQAIRFADSISGDDPSFSLVNPRLGLDIQYLTGAIEKMIEAEGRHFTTPVFPAMHGHDISVAHPMETEIIKQAKELLGDKYQIEHTDLEGYWKEVEKHLDYKGLKVLEGERRSYLKTGMWTYLFPATISARTYLKQHDFHATTKLVSYAEPLAALAFSLGNSYPASYMDRAWRYLLSNHTHDANGGCAPDAVCQDMEYRYRKTADISDIVSEQSMTYVAAHTASDQSEKTSVQLVVFNPLPFENDAMIKVDLEMPAILKARSVSLVRSDAEHVDMQPICQEKSSVFVDNIWDVPTILNSDHLSFYAHFRKLPPLGYHVYKIRPQPHDLRKTSSLLTSANSMENEFLVVQVNPNGTVTIKNKATGRVFENLNYITDQGETGNAWQHESPRNDQIINSLGTSSRNSVITEGPLLCTIRSEFVMWLPADYGDGTSRSEQMKEVPVCIDYTLEKSAMYLKIRFTVTNNAKDHWLRVNFPAKINTDHAWADSHFDVVRRDIAIPDSTAWVEEARGTHPLRTFVDLHDEQEGLACLTKGIFEYEVFDNPDRTMALTLIRACRIKLKVSEEKITELADEGIQCPGKHHFEYAIYPHTGDHAAANLIKQAARFTTPARALMSGQGNGSLPGTWSMFSLDNPNIHITTVKMAEDQSGIIIRMFNTTIDDQVMNMTFPKPVKAIEVRMDEEEVSVTGEHMQTIQSKLNPKQILTIKIVQ